ncbi:MAG: beta-eliminating lyase-related protein [Flavobacteriaceae bacterium]|nr:beta-eliminating lyase-related protein [Flavobacteriaceae bacterium]
MKRRNFTTKTAATAIAIPYLPRTTMKNYKSPEDLLKNQLPVNFTRDGINLSPSLYSQIFEQLTLETDFKPDSYGLGGMIHHFEVKVAKALGKEKAIYMPTGTLANHIALRQHCIVNKRAIVQYESHINRDSGDCATALSGINLITLGTNKVIYGTAELEYIIKDSTKGKVKTPIGVLSLETPLRRRNLKRIPFIEIVNICKIARENNIALHLDGARLYIDAAFSGKNIKEYTQLFDTVYLSLYKSFNSINGAILAGSNKLIEGLHNERRMFGGGLASSWQQIAIANYFFDNYEERYTKAKEQFALFKNLIEKSGKFKIETLENGSNVFKLTLGQNIDPKQLKLSLEKQQLYLHDFNLADQCFYIKMNDSLVYNDMIKTANAFLKY